MNNVFFLEVGSLWDIFFLLKFPGFFQLRNYQETMFLGPSERNGVIVYPDGNFGNNVFFLRSIVSPPACPCPTVPPPQVSILQWSLWQGGPVGSFTMCLCLGWCLLFLLGTACLMGPKRVRKVLQNIFVGWVHYVSFLSMC